ncbi:MAG: OB-fold nucleic acid binding domain-containing protein [Candidatus Nanoarchaeia archaeon]|jgi:RPA family protein
MFTQRNTAYKLRISDIVSGEFVMKDGESSYIQIGDKQVMRVRVLGTIVNKFTNDERKSGTIVIDDGTDSISARVWENDFMLVDHAVIGQLVDVIARVRMYNDEVYLIPEVIKSVSPDWLVLRKLELGDESIKPAVEVVVDTDLIKKLFDCIKAGGTDGASMEELVSIAGSRDECIKSMMVLLEDGTVFEPKAGRYKALD